ncbi:hypothetical protein NDU88_006379 [Pleurodeles waltl]|uniref:Uncharacterized protein n=1 Tax=Pleurodeles waltl TaxID=8319 RepID=A0AAV7LSF0_PLEWA|nr:hypothetical protein NDU88_006379 [Pleurodeles waltl]
MQHTKVILAAIQESKKALENQFAMLAGEVGLLRDDHSKLKDRVKATEDVMGETAPQGSPSEAWEWIEMQGLRHGSGIGKEGFKTWITDKKKRRGAGARKGPASVPTQEQIKAAQIKALRDLSGTTEIRLSDRWRELAMNTGGTGTEQSGSATESETDQLPQVTPMTADLLG